MTAVPAPVMPVAQGRTAKTRYNRATLAQPFHGFVRSNPGKILVIPQQITGEP